MFGLFACELVSSSPMESVEEFSRLHLFMAWQVLWCSILLAVTASILTGNGNWLTWLLGRDAQFHLVMFLA